MADDNSQLLSGLAKCLKAVATAIPPSLYPSKQPECLVSFVLERKRRRKRAYKLILSYHTFNNGKNAAFRTPQLVLVGSPNFQTWVQYPRHRAWRVAQRFVPLAPCIGRLGLGSSSSEFSLQALTGAKVAKFYEKLTKDLQRVNHCAVRDDDDSDNSQSTSSSGRQSHSDDEDDDGNDSSNSDSSDSTVDGSDDDDDDDSDEIFASSVLLGDGDSKDSVTSDGDSDSDGAKKGVGVVVPLNHGSAWGNTCSFKECQWVPLGAEDDDEDLEDALQQNAHAIAHVKLPNLQTYYQRAQSTKHKQPSYNINLVVRLAASPMGECRRFCENLEVSTMALWTFTQDNSNHKVIIGTLTLPLDNYTAFLPLIERTDLLPRPRGAKRAMPVRTCSRCHQQL